MSKSLNIAVIGAGAWGIGLACTYSRIGNVTLWSRSEPGKLAETGRLPRLPEIKLPASINVTTTLPREADVAFLVVPTQALRTISTTLNDILPASVPVIACCKGLEKDTALFPLEIMEQTMPHHPKAVLSGPNFAIEVAEGLPTAATLAASSRLFVQEAARKLTTPNLRLYASTDPIGVQLAGAAKNVIAIGAGITIGANLGENARAALITRALAELGRLVEAMGGQSRTIYGLAGVGDLILTCTGAGSRNYSLGVALGKGNSLSEILAQRSTVAEGALSAATICDLGPRYGVETPIMDAVYRLLKGELTPEQARDELLDRPSRLE
ncbi:NAD(P)H-dependent glycerol-3-phosphate dehydrogenase [Aristophania vespae]|uniref:Glycerol-3-phosphate dehydrogenase [NAD(P)+] n=1 Tax=Aristophania vespae TaxID=2697033 RepID=A0A6P1NIA2_9PROT|nr:NAD(P)H-dependent glycerol-3-phosphate dehydrogenase [Aristophania vespae]QHI95382.1 NAD(P)H-dependent glycerol-3-phosphate dehydrogenase [Aristophania vespae]UMM64658.1 Glycerol-3-phosphate dehydrogenase [NAD(P)+] [Aristophania vespae]